MPPSPVLVFWTIRLPEKERLTAWSIVAFVAAASTEINATSPSPIVSASAVTSVRPGWRTEFSRARRPVLPETRLPLASSSAIRPNYPKGTTRGLGGLTGDARQPKTQTTPIERMARGGLEPPTPRFSVVGQPALTRSAERSKKWLFAGGFGTPSAVAAGRAVHRDTCGYERIPVGLCRDAGVGDTNPEVGLAGSRGPTSRPR